MKQIKHFLSSILYSFLSVMYFYLILKFVDVNLLLNFNNFWEFPDFRHLVVYSLYLSICLFFIFGGVCFSIKTIYHMVLFYYKTFVKSYDEQINLAVDENNIIRKSYVEFSNGKIIPINITKIHWENPETTDNQSTENKE